jgi:hypothetical protein
MNGAEYLENLKRPVRNHGAKIMKGARLPAASAAAIEPVQKVLLDGPPSKTRPRGICTR